MSEHRTLLLDADVYAFQAASAVQTPINWGEDETDDDCLWTLHGDATEATIIADNYINGLVSHIGADRVVLALTDVHNFRKDVLPTYKGNRKEVPKPLALPTVRQHFRDNYEVFERPGLEGDDILGILMTSDRIIAGEKICVTIDKDLRTIPGFHFNSKKRGDGIFEVTEKEAERYHLMQTLMGDATDGYSGCPNVGETLANEFLDNPYILVPTDREIKRGKRKGEIETTWNKKPTTDVWAGIVSIFNRHGFNEEYALQQARVARILRASDYDFKKKEPILWTPK